MANSEQISQEEIKSENLSATITKSVGCVAKIEAKLSSKFVKDLYKEALKNINKEVNIPGFRKGKAPDEIITKNYGPSIDREWKDIVANAAFFEIVNQAKLKVYKDGIKKVDIKNISKDEGATVIYDVETFPNVPTVDVASFNLPEVPRKPLTEQDLEDAIQNVRLRMAEWEPVTDRGAQKGDIVVVDVDVLDEPVHRPVHDLEVEVSDKALPNWMLNLVLGLKEGETAEGIRKWEPDFSTTGDREPPKDYKDERCRVTVKKLYLPKLPELDDEFAKKQGLDSVDALKNAVKAQKETFVQQQETDQLRRNIRKLLVDKYVFDIPSRMHEKEIKNQRNQTDEQLKKMNYSSDAHKEKLSNLEDEIVKSAHEVIRYNFLIQQIADANKMRVSKEELIAYFEPMMQNPMYQQMFMDQKFDMESLQNYAVEKILEQKVLDYLIAKSASKTK